MKKEQGLGKEKNFTKLTQKKGISLIVLIVTIIVIIILAAAVILTITKNNPVESAKEATFKEDVRSFQDELAMTVAKEYTDKQGQRDEKISTSEYGKIKECIPSFSEKYKDKFVIKEDKLVGTDELTKNEKTWSESLNISTSDVGNYTPEDCFIWGSDTEGEDGYNVIIGYKSGLQSFSKVSIPPRCHQIICDGLTYTDEYLDDDKTGRSFLNNIQKIEIPQTVIKIGKHAFGGIYGNSLKSVTEIAIPDSVTSIGEVAFDHCSSLISITIPEGVTSIGAHAFDQCSSLTNVTILSSVANIEGYVFRGCSSLTNITYNGTQSQCNSINKDSGWKNGSSIKTITCTDGVITL